MKNIIEITHGVKVPKASALTKKEKKSKKFCLFLEGLIHQKD